MGAGRFELTVEDHFAAAHQLRGYQGKCEHLHGHNWKVELTIASGRLDELGMVADFKAIRGILKDVLAGLDHRYLNDIEPFHEWNPTCERLAQHIYREAHRLSADLPFQVAHVRVWESPGSSVTYREDA